MSIKEACEFCGKLDYLQTQDMGEGRTMRLCERCRGYIKEGRWARESIWPPRTKEELSTGGEVYAVIGAQDPTAQRLGLYISRIHKVWKLPLTLLQNKEAMDVFYKHEVNVLYNQGLFGVECRFYIREPDSFLREEAETWEPLKTPSNSD